MGSFHRSKHELMFTRSFLALVAVAPVLLALFLTSRGGAPARVITLSRSAVEQGEAYFLEGVVEDGKAEALKTRQDKSL